MSATSDADPLDSSAATPATNRPPAVDAETVALVERAQRGEVAAFNTLVIRHQNAAYSLAYRFLGAREPAEDVTQEAFLRAY